MRPSILIGWGGALHFVASPNGPRTEGATLANSPGRGGGSLADTVNEWNASAGAGSFSDYYAGAFGGPMAVPPGGLSNHKPGAFYFGDFYYFQNNVSHQESDVYLLRYDGSGLFKQATNSTTSPGHFTNKSMSGRGVDFLTASGSHSIDTKSLCAIVHNDVLFYVGAFAKHAESVTLSAWRTLEDWNIKAKNLGNAGADAGTSLPRRRVYGSFTIHKKNKVGKDFRDAASNLSIKHNRTTLEGLAPDFECLHGCDAISFKDDIIYANSCDVIRFPGGSGTPRFIERNNVELSPKCFEIYPSGGFSDNAPIGVTQVMMLTGSGVLKKINLPNDPDHDPSASITYSTGTDFASGVPFGTKSLIDIGRFVSDFSGPKVRNGGFRGRVNTISQEPARSCLLKQFNKQLHAFFISSTSGYYHFVCDGDPRNTNNWTDRTAFVPSAMKLFDGDLFGYTDERFGTLNVAHVAKSNIGAFGMIGGDRGAGAWSIYSIDFDLNWNKISFGGASAPPCGLIPYDPNSVYAQAPSGVISSNPQIIPSTDYALLTYKLYVGRAPNRLADIDVDYSVNDGITWNEARQFKDYSTGAALGDGKTNLEASPNGTEHEFYWAHVVDVGFNEQNTARLRIRPRLK